MTHRLLSAWLKVRLRRGQLSWRTYSIFLPNGVKPAVYEFCCCGYNILVLVYGAQIACWNVHLDDCYANCTNNFMECLSEDIIVNVWYIINKECFTWGIYHSNLNHITIIMADVFSWQRREKFLVWSITHINIYQALTCTDRNTSSWWLQMCWCQASSNHHSD